VIDVPTAEARRAAGATVALILAGTALAFGMTFLIQGLAPGWSRDLRLVLSYTAIVLPLAIAVRNGTRFGFRRERLGVAVASGAFCAAVALGVGRPSLSAAPPSAEQAGMLGALAVVGLVEEAMFRGVLQSDLVAWLGRWRGLLATAVLFTAWHIPQRLLGGASGADLAASLGLVFLTGMMLGLFMLAVRNVVGPAILHTAINWLG
jgi:membrane protease YdiL (CAAX protease family)